MWDVNTAPIKNQVEHLLRQWSKRKNFAELLSSNH